ncbi:hypothetical protein [Dictyobacter arantiisoli]|nr:hypothetical protein [Dictyobacter arantiisoli]
MSLNVANSSVISTILRHDTKVTSYKIALLRAINDVVVSFPDVYTYHQNVFVPLRALADYWIAYYWPFVDPHWPIYQGRRSLRASGLNSDIAFRQALTSLRLEWEYSIGTASKPSDGFFLINEMKIGRKNQLYSPAFLQKYQAAVVALCDALEMPICYAGPGKWSIFAKPVKFKSLQGQGIPVPGTLLEDRCLVINAELWQTFRDMSLWVEALCIHEWCLFTERLPQENQHQPINRGDIYRLLTDRPDNRRPLTWERNHIDILLLEGTEFICPWTEKSITQGVSYHLDHLMPLSVYPMNELWNLAPSDPHFNAHQKRDRLPSSQRLASALPHLTHTYANYLTSLQLASVIKEDVNGRFATVPQLINQAHLSFPQAVSQVVGDFLNDVAVSRNLARF